MRILIAEDEPELAAALEAMLKREHYSVDVVHDGADALVKGQNYKYAQDYKNHWVAQQYLPDAIKDAKYYTYGDNRAEQAAKAYWDRIKGEEG